MEKLKKIDGSLRLTIIGIVIAAIMCIGAALNYVDTRAGSLEGTGWEQTEAGTYEMEGFQLGMRAGKYSLDISYDSAADLSYRVVDMQRNNGENELGEEIASGTFPKGEDFVRLEFELQENAGKLTLYLESSVKSDAEGYWSLETKSGALQDFLFVFLCLCAALIFLYRFRDWKKHGSTIIVITAALILTLPYFTGYLQNGDDMDFHLARIRGLAGALASGQFPVRLNTDFAWGYGFSSSMMYPELFMYIPAILYLLGVSLISAYKFLMLCLNIATACVGLYSFKRLLRSERLGLIVALLYLTNPYRLENILHRAALGEMLAQIFLPLLMYGMYEIIFGNAKKWWIIVVAGTGILQSHILSVEMSLFFVGGALVLGAVYIARHGWKERVAGLLKAAAVAVGVNLWFIVPFLAHFGDDNLIQEDIRILQNTSVDLYTLFRVNMKLQGSYVSEGVTREEFISLGAVVLLGSLAYIYYAFIKKTVEERLRKIGNICLCVGTLCCYISTRAFPWRIIQTQLPAIYDIIGKVQFSWRFLAYASLFLSITTGIAIVELMKDKKQVIVSVLAGLAVFMVFSCMDQYASREIFVSSRSEVKNRVGEWYDYYAADVNAQEILEQGDTIRTNTAIDISGYERNGVELSFDYSGITDECTLRLPIYDYGMYRIYLNGEEIDPAPSENHQLTILLTGAEASGHVDVEYHEPVSYKLASVCSVVVIAGIAVYGLRRKRRLGNK